MIYIIITIYILVTSTLSYPEGLGNKPSVRFNKIPPDTSISYCLLKIFNISADIERMLNISVMLDVLTYL